MTQNLSKLSLSLVASALLAGNALALDPAITNFGYIQSCGMGGCGTIIIDLANPTKQKNIAYGGFTPAISANGAWFYANDLVGNNLVKINAYDGQTISTTAVGTSPVVTILSPDETKAYVINNSSNTISVVNTATNNITATIAVGTTPASMILSPDGTKGYITNVGDGTVSVINLSTNTIASTITSVAYPLGIAINNDGSKLYVADNATNTISVINTADNSVESTIAGAGNTLLKSADGTKLYVSGGPVKIYSTTDNSLLQTVNTGGNNNGLSLSPDGKTLYVNDTFNSDLIAINTTTYATSTLASGLPFASAVDMTPMLNFISPNLLTGTLDTSSVADMTTKGFTNYVNFAGGTLRATGSFTLSNPVYLHDAFNLTYDDSSTFTTVAGGTVDTNSYNVEFSGEVSGVGGLTKTGVGTLTLSGTNTYSGGTTVSGGTLKGTTDSLQGNITNNATVEFSQNTDGTYADILSGTGALTKSGTGILTLPGVNTYTGDTAVNAGTLSLSGGSAIVDTGVITVASGATLDVATTETVGSVSGAGNITLTADLTTGDNNTDDAISGIISGAGALTKSGTGTLTLSGTNTYTGATAINGGTLAVTGDTSTSAFSVNNGGTLSGTGTVGDVTVASGGILAPTNVSTLNVAGNLVMNAGSTLNINAYANGTNSKVSAIGTATINGGNVAVHSDSAGTWNTSTDYTILSATGGVAGIFTSVTDDLAFLTPTLTYGANAVTLNLARDSAVTYASKGTNGYSAGVGTVLDNLGTPNAQMQALIDVINGTNDAGAAQMLAQLSGAPLGSLAHLSPTQTRTFAMSLFNRMSGGGASGGIGLASLAFADNSDMATTFRYLADAGAIGANGFQEPQKIGDAEMWIRVVGGRTTTDGDSSRNIADSTTTTGGLQAGIDKRNGEWMIGGSLGYLRSNSDQSGFDGKTDSYQFGLYASQESKEYRLSFNAIGGKYNNSTSRTTPTGTASADFDGMALSAEVKAAYKVPLNSAWSMEPTIGGWVQRYAQDAYSESGAAGSNLSIDKATFTSKALTTELKLINTFGETKNDKGTFETSLGYTRESGDINAPLVGRFSAAPSAGSFSIASAERGRDVLTAMVGGDITVAANTRLFALVNGNWRENESGYSAVAGVKIGF